MIVAIERSQKGSNACNGQTPVTVKEPLKIVGCSDVNLPQSSISFHLVNKTYISAQSHFKFYVGPRHFSKMFHQKAISWHQESNKAKI